MESLALLGRFMEIVRPPLTVCVDFDGTLCDSAYPNIGPLKEGAKEALQTFRNLGCRIIISSCRSCHWHYDVYGGDPGQPVFERTRMKEMIAFLDTFQIPYDIIDDGSLGKVVADYYIDDKAIRFVDNWGEIASYVGGEIASSSQS
jgi:hypothetical protein